MAQWTRNAHGRGGMALAAGWMFFRAELRRRWRAWLALALIVGAFAGVVEAAAAGARRTDAAYPSLLAWSDAPDLLLFSFPGTSRTFAQFSPREAAAVPQARQAAILAGYPVASPAAAQVIAPESTLVPSRFWRRRILSGRLPDPARPDEVDISFTLAQSAHLGAGDVLHATLLTPAGLPVPFAFRIVGIDAAPSEFPPQTGTGTDTVWATPAFYRAHRSGLDNYTGVALRLRRGSADLPAVRREISRLHRGQVRAELPAGHPGGEHGALHPPAGRRAVAGGRAARRDQRAGAGAVAGPDELPGLGGVRRAAGARPQPPDAAGRRPLARRRHRRGRRAGRDPGRAGHLPAAARRPGRRGRALPGNPCRWPRLRPRGGRRGADHDRRDRLADLAGGERRPGDGRPGAPGPGQPGGSPGATLPGHADLRHQLGHRPAGHPAGVAARRGPDRSAGAQHRGQRGGGRGRAHRGAGLLGQSGPPAGHAPAVRRDLGRVRQ